MKNNRSSDEDDITLEIIKSGGQLQEDDQWNGKFDMDKIKNSGWVIKTLFSIILTNT